MRRGTRREGRRREEEERGGLRDRPWAGQLPSHQPQAMPRSLSPPVHQPRPCSEGLQSSARGLARAGQRHGCARRGQWRHWTLGLLPVFLPSQTRRGTKGRGRPRPGASTSALGPQAACALPPPGRRPRGCQDGEQRCSGAQGGGLVPPSPPDQLRPPSSSPASRAAWTLSRSRSHGPHLDLQWRQARRGGWGRERPQAQGGCSRPWGRASRGATTESLQISLIVV